VPMKRKSRRAQTSAHPHRVAAEQASPPRATRAGRRWTVTLEGMEIRPVTAEEFPAFLQTTESAFHEDVTDDELARWRTVFEPERSLAVFDGSAMVATAAIFTRELTIPGALMSVA